MKWVRWLRRKWRSVALASILATALSAFVLSRIHTPTYFHATIHTQFVSFTVGPWTKTAGLFAGRNYPVKITIFAPYQSRIGAPFASEAPPAETHTNRTLKNVRLPWLWMPEGTRVDLEVFEGSLKMILQEPRSRSGLFATVTAGDHDLSIFPTSGKNKLELSIQFLNNLLCDPPKEVEIPLSDTKNTQVSFSRRRESGISKDFDNVLTVEGKRTPMALVTLGGLEGAKINNLILLGAGNPTANQLSCGGSVNRKPSSHLDSSDIHAIAITLSGDARNIRVFDDSGRVQQKSVTQLSRAMSAMPIGKFWAFIASIFGAAQGAIAILDRINKWRRPRRIVRPRAPKFRIGGF